MIKRTHTFKIKCIPTSKRNKKVAKASQDLLNYYINKYPLVFVHNALWACWNIELKEQHAPKEWYGTGIADDIMKLHAKELRDRNIVIDEFTAIPKRRGYKENDSYGGTD
jgi:hypothetical protein